MTSRILLYGATGYSGRLIAAEARRSTRLGLLADLEVVLGGRDRLALEAMTDELDLDHIVFALDDRPRLKTALSGFDVVIISQWSDPRESETCTQWCRDTYAALKPFLGSARYMNYLAHDESDASAAVYGPNYPRLQQLKTKYDPENFFHTNVNIRPA